jgi:hypothetical protein
MALIVNQGNIRSEEEKSWDELVDQIWAGNVIPVIGDNLVVEGTTVVRELLEYLAAVKGIKKTPKTFSELYYNEDFAKYQPDLYEEVSSLIKANQEGFQPTGILEEFLSIEQFPFVITTSVDYTVEETMKKIWGKRGRKVRTVVFSNNPNENSDIQKVTDIKDPTVYYMFGKADKNREHSFVLTEEDMLSFCQSWLSEKHPPLLSSVIGSKYLLFLGVNYPDWLIRFMWYSMRSNLRESGMLVDNRELEGSLVEFFQRVSIRTQNTPTKVVREITRRLAEKKIEFETTRFDSVPEQVDFFISYSRRDTSYAEQLYEALSAQGFNVWYDKKDIVVGHDWAPAILKGIRTARKFIALVSDNVILESKDHHVYHSEWDVALAQRMNDLSFVIPVMIGDVNFGNSGPNIPEEIKHMSGEMWGDHCDVASLASKLVNLL